MQNGEGAHLSAKQLQSPSETGHSSGALETCTLDFQID